MRMTTPGFVALIRMLDDTARRVSGRRPALVTEGGYHLDALRECLTGAIGVLS
jgi:acetoin utilization deacetylase AcuC-like enzyme